MNESLKYMKYELKRQTLYDDLKLKAILPSVSDVYKSLDTLE
jgi:hypothetical protein